MQKTIVPSAVQAEAEVNIPSSKSLSHRALIAAALAPETSVIRSLSHSQDTDATQSVLMHLGALFTEEADYLKVQGVRSIKNYDGKALDCGESGSTLRFLIPLFSLTGKETIFIGRGRLMKRPQTVYADIFTKNNLLFDVEKNTLHVRGPLPFGHYAVDGSVSSQFISGLLFALPLLEGDSSIEVTGDFASESYVILTLDVLAKAGIRVERSGSRFFIPGGQTYQPLEYTVDGDDSQAAFFVLLSLIQQRPIKLKHLSHESRQGDHIVFQIIQQMGGRLEEIPEGYEIMPGELKGTEVDLADCPDLGPALFALATQAEGETIFHHTGRLRLKESDRIAAMEEELSKMGGIMTADDETVIVSGKTPVKGGTTVSSHGDHRIAMALAALSSIADQPVVIEEAEAVNKSYPDFFLDLASTGVIVE